MRNRSEKYHVARSPAINQLYKLRAGLTSCPQPITSSSGERHPVNLRALKFQFAPFRRKAASHSGVTMGRCDDSEGTRSPGRGRPGQPAAASPPRPAGPSPPPLAPPPPRNYLLRHGPEQARPVLGDQFPIQAQFPQIGVHGRCVLAGPRATLVPAVGDADGRLHVAGPATGQARRGLAPHGQAAGSSTPRPGAGGGSGWGSGSASGGRRLRPEAAFRALRAHRGALPNAWLSARGRLLRANTRPQQTGGAGLRKTPRVSSHFPTASLADSGPRPGVATPTSFLVRTGVKRENPRPWRARWAGSGEARPASPAHSPRREPRKPKKKDAAFRFPTSLEDAGGAGSGWGRPGEHSTSQPRICFRFRPDSGEDGGRCSLGSRRKSACGRRGRAGRPTRGRRPGGARTTSPYSAGAAATAPSGLRAALAPRSRAGRGALPADVGRAARAARQHCRCAAGNARARLAWSCQGHGGAVSALCVFLSRGRTCLLPSPRPALLAFPWRWL